MFAEMHFEGSLISSMIEMINLLCQNETRQVYSLPLSRALGNHTVRLNEMDTWKFSKKNLDKSWKYHVILSLRKSGNTENIEFYADTDSFTNHLIW